MKTNGTGRTLRCLATRASSPAQRTTAASNRLRQARRYRAIRVRTSEGLPRFRASLGFPKFPLRTVSYASSRCRHGAFHRQCSCPYAFRADKVQVNALTSIRQVWDSIGAFRYVDAFVVNRDLHVYARNRLSGPYICGRTSSSNNAPSLTSTASMAQSLRSTCGPARKAPEGSRQRFPVTAPHLGHGTEDNSLRVMSFILIGNKFATKPSEKLCEKAHKEIAS
jgi:hypothetical protein